MPAEPQIEVTARGDQQVYVTLDAAPEKVRMILDGGRSLGWHVEVRLTRWLVEDLVRRMNAKRDELAAELAPLDQPGPPPDLDLSGR